MVAKLALAVGLTALLAGCSSSPESTLKSFYRAVENQDDAAALKILHPVTVQMMGEPKLKTMLVSQRAEIKRCGGIKDIDVKLDGSDEQKRGTYTITFSGKCAPNGGRVTMVKLDGSWHLEM